MRYMGDAADVNILNAGGWSAATKAELMVLAPTLARSRAADLCDVADETSVGGERKWMRIALGAAAGVALAVGVGRVLRGRF